MEKEANFCAEQLDCNVIVVKASETKVLRLNLVEPRKAEPEVPLHSRSSKKLFKDTFSLSNTIKVPNVTPTSSPDRMSSMSSLDMFMSPSFMSDIDLEPRVKQTSPLSLAEYYYDGYDSGSEFDNLSSVSTSIGSLSSAEEGGKLLKERVRRSGSKAFEEGSRAMNLDLCMNVREMVSLHRNAPSDPPPLCSVCRHKSPFVGKPPSLFTYSELEEATRGFSEANFLAEGGYGSVHRGILPDGQVIAVKQHKLASTQGDLEFCSEVQALSCAQHRNVVMLIGYCVEDRRRLLVYEYICNGSLDWHLYGKMIDKAI